MACSIGYEISLKVPGLSTQRSVIFTSRRVARQFQKRWKGAKLHVVELCDGKIRRRGKRTF